MHLLCLLLNITRAAESVWQVWQIAMPLFGVVVYDMADNSSSDSLRAGNLTNEVENRFEGL